MESQLQGQRHQEKKRVDAGEGVGGCEYVENELYDEQESQEV